MLTETSNTNLGSGPKTGGRSAPTGLAATPGDQQVILTWSPNSELDLARYRIYRDTSSPASILIDSVVGTPPDTIYNDAGLTNGLEYFYRITAVDTAGNESGFSDEVSATPVSVEIALSDTSRAFGNVQVDSSASWTFYIRNDGTDTLSIDNITNVSSAYSVSPTAGEVNPSDSLGVTVTFAPSAISIYLDTLRIRSNDSDALDTLKYFYLSGAGMDTLAPAAPTGLAVTPGNQQVTLAWSTNSEGDLAKYRIYRDISSPASTRIDSVVGVPPDTSFADTGLVVGQQYYYRVTAIDTSGNESEFSDEVTGIPVDLVPPTISSISSVSGFLIPEYDTLTISCTINDNDFVDSAWAIYFNDYNVSRMFTGSFTDTSYSGIVKVPPGVTDSAYVVVYAVDASLNIDSLYSDFISVTDNTPPSVTIIKPTVEEVLEIGGHAQIEWSAVDNVGPTTSDLGYRVDEIEPWNSIAEGLSDTTYQWLVPNQPTESLTLRIITWDGVGLSDTASASNLQIVIAYPTIVTVSDPAVPLSWQNPSLAFKFSQIMDTAVVTDSRFRVHSLHTPEPNYDISFSEDLTILQLQFTQPLASLDTVNIFLIADMISNLYGYQLDGNENGIPEGSPTDDIAFTYTVLPYADFDSSLTIDFDDLTRFVTAWYAKDYNHELGPSSGTVPHLLMEPDSEFNGRDLITFIRMWDWYSEFATPLAKAVAESNSLSTELSYSDGKLLIRLNPVEGLVALHLRLAYPQDRVQIPPNQAYPDHFGLALRRDWHDLGITEIDIGLPSGDEQVFEFQVDLKVAGRDAVDVSVYIEAVDQGGSSLGGVETAVEVKPIPTDFALHQNYPNPFNPNTTILYDLPAAGEVLLVVYDIRGREVVRLVNEQKEAGYHQVIWNSRDKFSRGLASGVYIYRIVTPQYSRARKMLLLK